MVQNLKEAVELAKKITKANTICVLSPAASSYGYFKNFEERGKIYKQLVLKDNIKVETNN
jgi:UDP-N-acetylmuramoylalanine--D-glutamate ligase